MKIWLVYWENDYWKIWVEKKNFLLLKGEMNEVIIIGKVKDMLIIEIYFIDFLW